MRPYDDKRYLEWFHEFQKLVHEFLDTEGNTEETLHNELETAIENASDGEPE
jgi:hypothetical protein